MCWSASCGSARIRRRRSPSRPTKQPGRSPTRVVRSRRAPAWVPTSARVCAAWAETSALPAQWDRLAVCWQLAADHGLAMSTLMRAAQRDIVERQRFSAQVKSAMAGARATAAILAALPVLSVLLGELIGADPMAFLLGGQPAAGCWSSG